MQKLLKWVAPAVFLMLCIGIASILMATKPEPQRRIPPTPVPTVNAMRLAKQTFQVIVPSQGVVQARTRSSLIPQVSGEITWISESFRSGGFFKPDEELVKIDPRDYETALVVAKATLAQRASAYEVEKAQHEQAKVNWGRLGNGEKASALVLREPQLAEAKALMESAAANVERAERDLERTVIKAPYEGRIMEKNVDVGQTVSPGTTLAEIFATDYVEIRLPLRNEHLDFVDLPEMFRDLKPQESLLRPAVRLTGQYGSRDVTWNGRVVRTQSAFDARSRELFVIAQVDDPYGKVDEEHPPLKINQYVRAEIQGDHLEDVFVVPRAALRNNDEVVLIGKDNKIIRRAVEVIWRQGEQVVIRDGVTEGEVLCLSSLLFAADGAEVRPVIEGEPVMMPDGKGNRVRQGKTEEGKPGNASQTQANQTKEP
ncbi:MAG: efflux RND transporter periplasmic adaptor subunit [Verrucomicrobia bacterium]|nr:efflux RND transporter periplasmic adaptor subunit [Verrucomicrobiota bacterium]